MGIILLPSQLLYPSGNILTIVFEYNILALQKQIYPHFPVYNRIWTRARCYFRASFRLHHRSDQPGASVCTGYPDGGPRLRSGPEQRAPGALRPSTADLITQSDIDEAGRQNLYCVVATRALARTPRQLVWSPPRRTARTRRSGTVSVARLVGHLGSRPHQMVKSIYRVQYHVLRLATFSTKW